MAFTLLLITNSEAESYAALLGLEAKFRLSELLYPQLSGATGAEKQAEEVLCCFARFCPETYLAIREAQAEERLLHIAARHQEGFWDAT